jgi:hypothetical protein
MEIVGSFGRDLAVQLGEHLPHLRLALARQDRGEQRFLGELAFQRRRG